MVVVDDAKVNGATLVIRGLRVHNLKNVDLDLPLRNLVLITGVSGSGKSSLAFDTLFAEGQRRYVETFSAYTRQFLERMDRPEADLISGIPPAIAIRQRFRRHTGRSTVGSLTEVEDFLRLLFAKAATVSCLECGCEVRRYSPDDVTQVVARLPSGTRFLVTFRPVEQGDWRAVELVRSLRERGFVRAIAGARLLRLTDAALAEALTGGGSLRVVVDRCTAGQTDAGRVRESIETGFTEGGGEVELWLEHGAPDAPVGVGVRTELLDGGRWTVWRFGASWRCHQCGASYPEPDHRLFSANSSVGACPTCRGFGDVMDIDESKVVPDPSRSVREGAIAPWGTPLGRKQWRRFVNHVAPAHGFPLDTPYQDLTEREKRLLWEGDRKRGFSGIRGLFQHLEEKKYKMHVRVFLSRFRGYQSCPECKGTRLRREALAARVGGLNFAEVLRLRVDECLQFVEGLSLDADRQARVQTLVPQIVRRLRLLRDVGLHYLTLDRPTRTLSGGEVHRVALSRVLGSGLVNTLYVLDEPSVGLHERDTDRLLEVIRRVRDEGNTVVVVEHDLKFLRIADHVVDLGPGGGARGGRVVYQGPVHGLAEAEESVTGKFVSGRQEIRVPPRRRQPGPARIRLVGARGHNLKDVTVEFPLHLLCVVTGVSGAGKSSLVLETLYPAILNYLGRGKQQPLPHRGIEGLDWIDDAILVDQNLTRSSRSNPVTYTKALDVIRRLYATTFDAKLRGYGPGHFSFNSALGCCPDCDGLGIQIVDMQFLADVAMTCPSCGGKRYRPPILEVRYRGRTIAEVLEMTVHEALQFFRHEPEVVQRLEPLVQVGLDYLTLGQSCATLSGGELQRLKLASFLSRSSGKHTLFIFDEPTNGLHLADLHRLLDCLHALLRAGHSIIVVEHNMELIKCADWVIDLGPEADEMGGKVVAFGPPEEVARCPESITGQFLRRYLPGITA